MTLVEQLLTIAIVAGTTFFTRCLSFLIFSGNKDTPKLIKKLGDFLPTAIIGMLVIYCFKDLHFTHLSLDFPMIFAGLLTAGIHFWKKNMLLSMAVGTIVYLLIVNVF